MAKQIKDKWLGARVDLQMDARVTAYTAAAETTMGDLVRDAVNEYMVNHPVKHPDARANVNHVTKPGE